MKILDKTPYRNEGGVVDIFGRVRGTLKYGTSWYARLKAQDMVIAVFDKILGANFTLLRNCTLHDTEIDLPLVLIGPPGIYMINITDERGVYQAREDQWGTISGENFVPAGINQMQRTYKLGRVLQLYLDRAGYKGSLPVEPILMAPDPGMHVESIRPVARVVMSDALELFALSLSQSRPIFNTMQIEQIVQTILKGPRQKTEYEPEMELSTPETAAQPVQEETDNSVPSFSPEALGFSFEDEHTPQGGTDAGNPLFEDAGFSGVEPEAETFEKPVKAPGKTRVLGMTRPQLLILGGILAFWIISIVLFAIYIFFSL